MPPWLVGASLRCLLGDGRCTMTVRGSAAQAGKVMWETSVEDAAWNRIAFYARFAWRFAVLRRPEPLIYGIAATGLHIAAFGLDPMRNKGMDGVDTFQHDRVARVVDEAEKHLGAMREALRRAGDRKLDARMDQFQSTARALIQTVEDDPRDLTAARKYLGVYLLGARDATIKFADVEARSSNRSPVRGDHLPKRVRHRASPTSGPRNIAASTRTRPSC